MELEPNRPVYDWPLAAGEPGNEVWFLFFTSPDGATSFWYHVELCSTGETHVGRAWAAIMDRTEGELAFNTTPVDVDAVSLAGNPFSLAVGDHRLTSRSLEGHVAGDRDVSWNLEWEPDTYAFRPLRSRFISNLLSNTIGTGKYWSRNSSIAIDGTVTVGDRTLDLAGAPGSQGHIMSPREPMDLTWVHCNDFDTAGARADDVVFEALQFDRFLTCYLRLDGDVYEFNRVANVLPVGPRANSVEHNEVGEWRLRADSGGMRLRATVDAPGDRWHRAIQYPPAGEPQYVAHCPFASLQVSYAVEDDWAQVGSQTARVEWHRETPPVEGNFTPEWGR